MFCLFGLLVNIVITPINKINNIEIKIIIKSKLELDLIKPYNDLLIINIVQVIRFCFLKLDKASSNIELLLFL